MNKIFERIVDVVDARADRAIEIGINFLMAMVAFALIAWFLHLTAIAIAERGIRVDMQRHFNANPTYEEQQRSGTNTDLDRSGFQVQFINDRTGAKIEPSA